MMYKEHGENWQLFEDLTAAPFVLLNFDAGATTVRKMLLNKQRRPLLCMV